jgi:hypothetical protein
MTKIVYRGPSEGQQAMATAKLYPEAEGKGGRGGKSILKIDFNRDYLVKARTVLRWLPQIADMVLAGSKGNQRHLIDLDPLAS